MMKNNQQSRWIAPLAILLLSAPLLFLFLGGWSFLDPDEGRYGTIPYQMIARADFITPTQNQIKFFDKPPLLYWLIAASYSVFGNHEWAARLVPALAALAGVFTAYALGKCMFGARAGLLAAVILVTSLMWLVMGRFVVTDMLVSSLVFQALALWWLGHAEDTPDERTPDENKTPDGNRRQTYYFLGFWVVLALAFLAKGPISVVLTGGCIGAYTLLCRQTHTLSRMRWAIGLPIFGAMVVPWFYLVALRNPEFNHFFWYDQHIGRFLGNTTGNDHRQSPVYYLKLLPLVFFPWSFFAPAAVAALWKQRQQFRPDNGGPNNFNLKQFRATAAASARLRALVYLGCGTAFTLLFFSASSGKLLTYILPVVPLLALLMAAYFDWLYRQTEKWNRILTTCAGALCLGLLAAGAAVFAILPGRLQVDGIGGPIAVLLGGTLATWAIALAYCCLRFRLSGLIAATGGGFAATAIASLLALTVVVPHYTTRGLVEYIQPGLASHPESEVLTMGYIRSIPFYTNRRVEILGAPDELEFGVQQMPLAERDLWVHEGAAKLSVLQAEMKDAYPVYCFIEKSKGNRRKLDMLMAKIGGGAGIIAANEGFLVFGNRAALAVTPPLASLLNQEQKHAQAHKLAPDKQHHLSQATRLPSNAQLPSTG